MKIVVKGMERLQKKLKDCCDLDDVRKVVQYHGAQMQQTAQVIVPVDTGFLKSSIRLDILDGGMTAEVEPMAEYAAYVEYGTRFMAAQPYIRPAFMQERARFRNDLDKLMK